LTTYLGKILGIQGWRDYHVEARVEGKVTHAAWSTDFFYTIDLQVEHLYVEGRPVVLTEPPKFIRVEVLPFARIGAPLPVCEHQEVSVSGKLVWDGDGFLEIHPKRAKDIQAGNPKVRAIDKHAKPKSRTLNVTNASARPLTAVSSTISSPGARSCGLHRKCVFTGSAIATTASRNISTSRSLNPAASRCSASEQLPHIPEPAGR
jgi:hypothetical protein